MEENAPKKTVWTVLWSVSLATYLGWIALVLFLFFCRIDAYAIRWWLMLPLAAAAAGLFLWRRKRAPAAEARCCTLGLCLLLALVVLRDVGLSRKLAELYDKMQSYKIQVDQATSEIRHFFEGTR